MRITGLALLRKRAGLAPSAMLIPEDEERNGAMPNHATVSVPTMNGARYIQQLCKHWSHNLSVEFSEAEGRVVFPKDARGADWPGDAVLVLRAAPDALNCELTASAPEQLEALKGAVERHLDRFAFREAPLKFDWLPS